MVSFCVATLGVLVLIAFVPGRSSMSIGSVRPTLRQTVGILAEPRYRRLLISATLLGMVGVRTLSAAGEGRAEPVEGELIAPAPTQAP